MADTKILSSNVQDKFSGDKASMSGKNLHLAIEVREDSLYACFLDKDANQYLAMACFSRIADKEKKHPLETILKEDILNFKCSSSSVAFTHNSAMLIPSVFFSSDSVKDYLKQQNLIKQNETPCSDFIKNNDCHSLYAVNSTDYSHLKAKYPHAIFRHHSSVFVEYLLALHKGSTQSEVHVYVFHGYMDVVALQLGKLLLYNRYYFQTPDEFTYFLIWVYEELKLNPADSPCSLYGEIEEKSQMLELTRKYLTNIRLAEKPARFAFLPMLAAIPGHRYYSLLMQYQCI